MIKDGYIQLPRSITTREDYFIEKFTRAQAYADLFFLAAWTERTFLIRGNRITIQRGQVAVALRSLATRWKWSVNTVSKFLSDIQKSGEIDTQKTRLITVITLKNYVNDDTQNDTQNDTLNINNKEINNNKENSKKKTTTKNQGVDTLPDYVADNMRDVLLEWLAYKKERHETYKPRGLKQCYNKLIEYSGGDPEKAKLIIEKSMASNYSGFFPLKDSNYGNSNTRPNHRPTPDENIAEAQQFAFSGMQSVIRSGEQSDVKPANGGLFDFSEEVPDS